MKNTFIPGPQPAAKPTGRYAGKPLEESTTNWTTHLPEIWLDAVDEPFYFKRYSEYEMSADRTLGYDADDHPCFTSHRFVLTAPADNGEECHEVVTYSEEMAAWRLRDERWLIFRRVATNHSTPPHAFYTLSPDMPR